MSATSFQAAAAVANHLTLADSAVHTAGATTNAAVGGGMVLFTLTAVAWRYLSSHRHDKGSGAKKIHDSHRVNTVVSILIGLLAGAGTAIGVGAAHVASMIP